MGLGLMALEAWAQACGLRLMGLRLVEMGPISGSSSWVLGLMDACYHLLLLLLIIVIIVIIIIIIMVIIIIIIVTIIIIIIIIINHYCHCHYRYY